jgi:hypothetical protein
LTGADFHSAIAISESAPARVDAGPVQFNVYVECCGEPEKLLHSASLAPEDPSEKHVWRPVTIPLIEYAGKTIKLRLTAENKSGTADGWAMYRYPYIDLSAEDAEAYRPGSDAITPSNTELSQAFVRATVDDLVFDLTDPNVWHPGGLDSGAPQNADAPARADSWIVTGQEPSLTYVNQLSIQLADYSHLYVKMSASPAFNPRAVRVNFSVTGFREPLTATVPLLAGGGMHEYSYDLRLLNLPDDARLVGIKVYPAYGPAGAGEVVRLSGLRLIRRNSGAPLGPIQALAAPDLVRGH